MNNFEAYKPLADRMRPSCIEEFIGQEHILNKNSPLYNSIKNKSVASMIFYGPPGVGKTTLSSIIANTCNGIFKKLNAVSSGVGDAKVIIEQAKQDLTFQNKRTYLLLDECHRWNKAQSDCLLQAIEEGYITLIGSTTENPYISMTRAIVSRCLVFEFKPLTNKDIEKALSNAINSEKGLKNKHVNISPNNLKLMADYSGGDVRKALNLLEFATNSSLLNDNNEIEITTDTIKNIANNFKLTLNEDNFYDMLSAFCKSIRGSDAEAGLFYANKMLDSGIDPLIISRRLIAHASEDIGMADSNALLMAILAHNAVKEIGLPEARLNLSHAIIYLCEASKSNSVYVAMSKAQEDCAKMLKVEIPNNLKNHPSINKDGTGKYLYPHEFGGYVYQQYLPNELKNQTYYTPSNNGKEKGLVRKKVKK